MAHDRSDPKNQAAHAPDPDAPGDGDHFPLYGMRPDPGTGPAGAAHGEHDASEPRSGPDQAAYHRSGYGGYGGGQEAGDAAPGGIEGFEDENRVREARNPTPRTLPTGLDADPAPGTAATKPHTARK